MDKDRKMFIGIILLLLFFMLFVGVIAFRNKKSENVNNDASTFKQEYESLNNVVREKDGKTIKEIWIDDNNPVDIVNEDEAIELLEKGTGIIYFGFPDCPWCRSMLPVLFNTLSSMSIDKLYYLNISQIRDTLSLGDKNQVEIKEEGSKGYYRILELLDSVLPPYYSTNEEGKKIDTKEKRLLAPTVVGFKNGEITSIHIGTIETQKSGYDDLTDKEKEELNEKYMEIVRSVYDINCDENC